MSCIDAAIIKALVEHIGGNPDDVVGTTTDVNSPGGIGSGSRDNGANISLGSSGIDFMSTTFKIGSILRLKNKQTGYLNDFICIRSDTNDEENINTYYPYYFLDTTNGNIIKMERTEDYRDECSSSQITSAKYEYDKSDISMGVFYNSNNNRHDQVLNLLTLTTLVKYLFRRLDFENDGKDGNIEYNKATNYMDC